MRYNSLFLRWKMEQVWLHKGCVSPNHLANWSDYERGYRVYDQYDRLILLWFKKGKRMTSTLGCRSKGKGFTWLCRDYGIEVRCKNNLK